MLKEDACIYDIIAQRPLKILIAEDDKDISMLYKEALENRRHQVVITASGEDCLKVYHENYQRKFESKESDCNIIRANNFIFDVVILDCNMPFINGIQVAKEILAVNRHQRIIYASAYIKDSAVSKITGLGREMTESIQKPFKIRELIDLVEDKAIYEELKILNVDIDIIRAVNPTHEELVDLLERLLQSI